ncbi:MAG: SseB family protein [Hespellia sp.]|nr:SseB family protein [Hespellia sp.]
MKIIRKIMGVLLVILGILFAGFNFIAIIMEIYDITRFGFVGVVWGVILIIAFFMALGILFVWLGIWLFRGKKKPAEHEFATQIQDNQIPLPEADRFTMLVEDIFEIPTAGTVLVGVLVNGVLSKNKVVLVLKANGIKQSICVEQIEEFQESRIRKVSRVQGNARVGILVREMAVTACLKGDVVTNIEPNTLDINRPFENSRLKGLLAGRAYTKMPNLGRLIQKEISEQARFLVLMILDHEPEENGDGTAIFTKDSTMSFPYLTAPNGDNYQPVFTDWTELGKWELGEREQLKTMVMNQAEAEELVRSKENLKGIVINPFTDNYLI